MNYEESLAYISSTYPLGIKLGLENIERLLERLGNPQEKMRIIHVAGTNGKGSTCAFLSSMLTESGFRVGLYTSPYLEVFNERIRINGENIGNEVLALAATKVRKVIEGLVSEGYPHPSEFEVTTAIGFVCFEMEKAEIVVLEVGLGGRFDATNVVRHPLITVITSVSIDHVQFLGDTLGEIAFEKAGILKPGVPLVLYPQEAEAEKEILRVAAEKKVPVTKVETGSIRIKESSLQGQRIDARVLGELFSDLEIGLLGEHQTKNALTALTALRLFMQKENILFDREAVYRGMKKARWTGRLELLSKDPLTLIDGAHNAGGALVLAKTIEDLLAEHEITLVFGMLKDKEVEETAKILLPLAKRVITATVQSERSMPAQELADRLRPYHSQIETSKSLAEAVHKAERMTDARRGAIIYAGSLYMIGEVRGMLTKGAGPAEMKAPE